MFNTYLKELDGRLWNFTERWTVVRLIGEMTSVFEFWIPVSTKTGPKCVRKLCLDWDPSTRSHTGTCPYCKAGLRGRPLYYSNAIVRQLQTAETGADADSSPVRVLKIPPRLYQLVSSLASGNKKQNKMTGEWKQYGLAHPKWGRDVRIKINPANTYRFYDLEPCEANRLTAAQLSYPLVPLVIKRESAQQAKAAWRQLKEIIVQEDVST
jgi:hypothetical protein